jgi:hypothetical protein
MKQFHELREKNGLWDNIHAKRKRGEKMRKPGEEGAPSDEDLKRSQKENVDLDEGFKKGDMVVPTTGPHKGQKHEVIHCFDDGSCNIKPVGLNPKAIKYRLGAAKAKPSDLKRVNEDTQLDELSKNTLNTYRREAGYAADRADRAFQASDGKNKAAQKRRQKRSDGHALASRKLAKAPSWDTKKAKVMASEQNQLDELSMVDAITGKTPKRQKRLADMRKQREELKKKKESLGKKYELGYRKDKS